MLLSAVIRQRLTTFVSAEDAAHLERLADLVEAGQVSPVLEERVPLEQTADAIERPEPGRVRGKLVVEV